MRIFHTLLFMFIGSFIVQYFFMSYIMTNHTTNIKNSVGKLYLATIMGLFMVAIEIFMHDTHYSVFSSKYYVIIFSLLALFIYFYRTQKFINDSEFLKEMIEHHSMALLTTKNILEKTDNYDVTRIAKNIMETQKDEITQMNNALNKL